jgi:hypothetical protein
METPLFKLLGDLPLLLGLTSLLADPRHRDGNDGDQDQQRPQAKAEPAAAGLIGLDWLICHSGILPRHVPQEVAWAEQAE